MNFLDDPELSWEAKGMLAFYLRDKPKTEVIIGDIITESLGGKHKTNRIINDIGKSGYGFTDKFQDDYGHWHWETWFYATKRTA